MTDEKPSWWLYTGEGQPHEFKIPPAPPWRRFNRVESLSKDAKIAAKEPISYYEPDTQLEKLWTEDEIHRAKTFKATQRMKSLVNTAFYLRRPLLITGRPGTGKSSLAYAIAYELKLGQVLYWPITSRSTLQDALYRYDALGRLQDTNLDRAHTPTEDSREQQILQGEDNVPESKGIKLRKPSNIGKYIRLGPLGTALLPTHYPQVLLIDEIDKSSIDLPNDLLHIFETGKYEIPELSRLSDEWIDVLPQFGEKLVRIYHGKVTCDEFPLVVMTSNGERDMPPPFLRRCIRLDIKEPTVSQLAEIVAKKFPQEDEITWNKVLDLFMEKRQAGGLLATDQLLNAIYLRLQNVDLLADLDEKLKEDTTKEQQFIKEKLIDAILRKLNEPG